MLTLCLDDHVLAESDEAIPGELAPAAAMPVLKALYLARVGRPDILWTGNDLARKATKWTRACDKKLRRLMS